MNHDIHSLLYMEITYPTQKNVYVYLYLLIFMIFLLVISKKITIERPDQVTYAETLVSLIQ